MGKSDKEDKTNKDELGELISEAISDVSMQKEIQGIKSLSRHNPEKVSKILYLYSIGVSQTQMVRKYFLDRETIISTLVDYADYKNDFRQIGGKVAARNYLNLSSLNEDLVEEVRTKLESGDLSPQIRDLKDISIAMNNASQQAMTARGEATNITEERKVITQQDYDDTIKAAKDRIAKLRQVQEPEIIDINNE
jgi:hypothetical protein